MSLKKFTDSYLKSYGIDAHEVKNDYGCRPVSHYDLYNDDDTVKILDKKGKLFCDTGMSKDELIELYGRRGKNR